MNGEKRVVVLYQMVKCGLRVNSISITWERLRNANSLAQLQTLLILEFWEWGPEICALSNCPSSSDACNNLNTNGLKVSFTTQRREHSIVKLCVLLIKLIKPGKKSFVAQRSWFALYSITSLKIYRTSYYHSLSFFICKMILVITEIMGCIKCSMSIDLKAPQNLELKTYFGENCYF